MVNINIGGLKGQGKYVSRAKGATRKVATVAKARSTIRASQRGIVRTSGYYGRYAGVGGAIRGGELKFHDIDVDQAEADMSTGVIVADSVCLIGQGITESLRIGRKCTIKSINWRGSIVQSVLAAATIRDVIVIRLMLYQDMQANGATAAVTDILATADPQSFNNLANKGRFKTFYDKRFTLRPATAVGNGTANDSAVTRIAFQFFKKCDIPLEFSGVATPAAITEMRSNNIGVMMLIEDQTTAISMQSKMRLRFSDG